MGGAAASCAAAKMQPVAVADVIERLRTIEASAPASDGVACFARLYRAVTENVGADLTGRGFADARFLETLDVTFADLFFCWLAWIDRLVHRLRRIDDVVAMWDVDRARDAAWTNAQALWELGDGSPLASDYLLALDRMVGFASRGLLIPADSWLLRIGRELSPAPLITSR